MFLENPAYNNEQFGWIEVICGSMFSGKTEELIRRIKRAKIANQKVKIFKPIIDSRSKNYIESHDDNKLESIEVKLSSEILNKLKNCDVIAIDEAQFFDDGIVDVCNNLANNGIRVIIAGLDMDYLGNPFGPMPNLMAISEYVTKVHAVCKKSGNVANYSYRKNKKKDIKIALSDPMGSALYSYFKNDKLESTGSSITEGIGNGRVTKNFDKALIDDAFQTDDVEALNLVYDLIENQKIILGGSSGINIAGAIKLAKQLGPGKTIVTILCDHGKRYASKIFNKEFLKSKNLPIPKWL